MEAFKRTNVEDYLKEKNGLGDGGRFNKPFKINYKQEAELLAKREKIQSKKIEEALKEGREKIVKETKEEIKPKGAGDGGGAGPH